MVPKKKQQEPAIIPSPERNPEFNPDAIPENKISKEEELDFIPDEDDVYNLENEAPEPGEGP